jgi:quercetin dioxygenase-like cupin family protein
MADSNVRELIPLGEILSDSVAHQELDEVVSDLREAVDDSAENDYESVSLYNDDRLIRLLYYFEKGSYFTDRIVDRGTAILDVLEGKMCFQSGDVHIHPRAGETFYLESGTSHSLQADKPSTVLITIIKEERGEG